MPTYEYACAECGERLEAVQKFSDDPLTVCPACETAPQGLLAGRHRVQGVGLLPDRLAGQALDPQGRRRRRQRIKSNEAPSAGSSASRADVKAGRRQIGSSADASRPRRALTRPTLSRPFVRRHKVCLARRRVPARCDIMAARIAARRAASRGFPAGRRAGVMARPQAERRGLRWLRVLRVPRRCRGASRSRRPFGRPATRWRSARSTAARSPSSPATAAATVPTPQDPVPGQPLGAARLASARCWRLVRSAR